MPRWIVLAVVAAACGQPTPSLVGDDVAGDDAGVDPDAGIDDGPPADIPDAPPPAVACGTNPTTPEEWEACYLQHWCEMLVHCDEWNLYRSVEECVANYDAVSGGKVAFDNAERRRAIAAGRATLDVPSFTQCLAELSPARCSTAATAPSCKLRYRGTIPDQGACYTDAECRSPGARCEPQECGNSCCMGTCVPRKKLGEDCGDFDACEPGIVCSIVSRKCVIGDINAACGSLYDCDANAWCGTGTCRADLTAGQTCNSILQCGGETSCVGLMRMPVGQATCRKVTAAGDPCDWFCMGNFYCSLPATGLGVCKPLPAHNQACDALLPCVGQNEWCDQGTCVTRDAVGQACSEGTCLPGLFCTSQLGAGSPVCSARLPVGATCNRAAQCQSFICGGGQCQPLQTSCP